MAPSTKSTYMLSTETSRQRQQVKRIRQRQPRFSFGEEQKTKRPGPVDLESFGLYCCNCKRNLDPTDTNVCLLCECSAARGNSSDVITDVLDLIGCEPNCAGDRIYRLRSTDVQSNANPFVAAQGVATCSLEQYCVGAYSEGLQANETDGVRGQRYSLGLVPATDMSLSKDADVERSYPFNPTKFILSSDNEFRNLTNIRRTDQRKSSTVSDNIAPQGECWSETLPNQHMETSVTQKSVGDTNQVPGMCRSRHGTKVANVDACVDLVERLLDFSYRRDVGVQIDGCISGKSADVHYFTKLLGGVSLECIDVDDTYKENQYLGKYLG